MGRVQTWTDACEQVVKDMWDHHSASVIRETLHERFNFVVSRNSIIGKAHRLGLAEKSKKNPLNERKVRKITTRPPTNYIPSSSPLAISRKNKRIAAAAIVAEDIAANEATLVPGALPMNAVTYREREEDQCAWPVAGAGVNMMCCGNHINPRRGSYCAWHTRVGVQASNK